MNYRKANSFFFGLHLNKDVFENKIEFLIDETLEDRKQYKRVLTAFVKYALKAHNRKDLFIQNFKNGKYDSIITERQTKNGEIIKLENYYPAKLKTEMQGLVTSLGHLFDCKKKQSVITNCYIRWMLLQDKELKKFVEWFNEMDIFILHGV